VQGSSAPLATMPGDFMVGHIAVLIGQSEDHYMFIGDGRFETDGQSSPALTDEDGVFVLTKESGGDYPGATYAANGILPVTNALPLTRSMQHLADVLTRGAPGEKFLLVDATVQGTTYEMLGADGATLASNGQPDTREWGSTFADAIAILNGYGTAPGVIMSTWTAAPSTTGDGYRQRLYPFLFGQYAPDYVNGALAGTSYTPGDAMTDLDGRVYDHMLWDLTGAGRGVLDAAVTKMFFHGPHRFEDSNGLRQDKQDTRLSIRNIVDDAALSAVMLPKGPEILLYQNGDAVDVPGGNPFTDYNPDRAAWVGWGDIAHPTRYSDDGLPARARHTAVAMLYAFQTGPAAAQSQHVPRFNRAHWEPGGAWAEFWYESPDAATPPITTTRLARGAPAIPAIWSGTADATGETLAHRTEVAGFYIDAAPAQRAEIVAGRVRVYPISGSFTGNTLIRYGLGGASGVVSFPADAYDAIWKNLPIADLGIPGVDGVAVDPMPDPDDIAATLPAAAMFSVSGGAAFEDGVTLGANTGDLTFLMRGKILSDNATHRLFEVAANYFKIERLTSLGTIRLSAIQDTGGGVGRTEVLQATYPLNVMQTLVVSVSLSAQKVLIFLDGVKTGEWDLAANTGMFPSNQPIRLLNVGNPDADIERLAVWKGYAADGDTTALGVPYKDILPPASSVAADPWYTGTGTLE